MALLATVAALTLLSTVGAQFGFTCDGNTVPDVAALTNQYPPLFTIANIVQGDTVAAQAFAALSGPALAYAPSAMVNGAPSFNGYDAGADPNCWWSASLCTTPKAPNLPPVDAHTCPPPSTWGLSFDDGPTCFHAPLYALLAQNQQEATLFYIGSNVASYPNEARLGYDNGHTVCVHTWSHHYMTSLTNEEAFAELYYTKKIIKDVLGITPRCWRPPFGDVDDRIRTIATALELYTFIWDKDTADWEGDSQGLALPNRNYATILAGNYADQGTMVLTHEVSQATVSLFTQHWPNIQQNFRHVVSAHACYNITAPYAESESPTYPNFASWVAGHALATQNAPALAGSTGAMVFSGQAAFLASLNGSIAAPIVSPASASASPSSSSTSSVASSTSIAPAPTSAAPLASASSEVTTVRAPIFVSGDGKIDIGTLAGAAAGGTLTAILIAVLIVYARRRGMLCFRPDDSDQGSLYGDKGYASHFGSRSQQALLSAHANYSHSSLGGPNSPPLDGGNSQFPSHADVHATLSPTLGHPAPPQYYADRLSPPTTPTLPSMPAATSRAMSSPRSTVKHYVREAPSVHPAQSRASRAPASQDGVQYLAMRHS